MSNARICSETTQQKNRKQDDQANHRRLLAFLAFASLWLLHPAFAQERSQDQFQDEISYSNDIQPVVNNFCTTCHSGEDPDGGFVLTTYADVRKHAERGKLLMRINDSKKPMPQSGLMPVYLRRLFQRWASGGYLEKGKRTVAKKSDSLKKFQPPKIKPVDIQSEGFELLEKMQGHWVGSMNLMGQQHDWMAFDYRAISPSHVHGIFEGGSIGNLFTSFFVADFQGTRTIMARNGGILNGIYRTSYFVLDRVQKEGQWTTYRLVDAYGGTQIMWMELSFRNRSMRFSSYTSRFGLTTPRLHMAFQGKQAYMDLANQAAKAVGFPSKVPAFEFKQGLPKPNWNSKAVQTSASYIWQDKSKGLIELGKIAKDPIRIDQMPYVGQLQLDIKRTSSTKGKKLHLYLSYQPLTHENGKFMTRFGYIREELLNTLLYFPELNGKQDSFRFTYLHPGRYYLTVVADMDGDGFPSPGDICHPHTVVTVKPNSVARVEVKQLDVQN